MLLLAPIVLGTALGSSAPVVRSELAQHATACNLPAGADMFVVRYVDGAEGDGGPLCDGSGRGSCQLSGWLYKPSGKGPFPTIVLNHAAENPRKEASYCEVTERLVRRGYLVFQPLRRGYRGDAGLGQNSGELPSATLHALERGKPSKSSLARSLAKDCGSRRTARFADCVETKLLESQILELHRAIAWLTAQHPRWVDADRISMFGHGDGANVTAMLADTPTPPGGARVNAGVLVSPPEHAWDRGHPLLRKRLTDALAGRRFPLAFLQPTNAANVAPTEQLADVAVQTRGKQFMASLLPAVGSATATWQQRQTWFATRAKHVAQWEPLAEHFVRSHGGGDPWTGKQNHPSAPTSKTICDRLDPGTKVTVERYYDPPNPSKHDPLCDVEADGDVNCDLQGILYVPKGARDAPAIILNNGGGAEVRPENGFCTLIEYFTHHGFVVFTPRRRGVVQRESKKNDPDAHFKFRSTGKLMADVISETRDNLEAGKKIPREARPYAETCHLAPGDPKQDLECLSGELTRAEATEVGLAITWLEGRPGLVDPDEIAAVGHSNGGQVVIHAGALLSGAALPQAVIAIQPHEQGWDNNKYKGELLEQSVANAKVPLAILRPANSANLHSTDVLGQVAAKSHQPFLTAVLPAMPIPAEEAKDPGHYVHVAYPQEHAQIVEWGGLARRYMKIYGVE